MSDHRVRTVRIGAVLAVVLLAGGCTGTTTPPDGGCIVSLTDRAGPAPAGRDIGS